MHALFDSAVRMQALLAKEFRVLLRDVRMRFFVVVPPLVQLVVFGYAATFDIRAADVGVIDYSHSQEVRELLGSVASGGEFHLHYFPDVAAASDAMDRNQVGVIMQFAADFARRPVVQLIADGSDSNSAELTVGQLSQTIRQYAGISSGMQPPVQVDERAWFNPNLEDRDYFIPGIIANVVLVATMVLTAMAVVRERELGTLERLLVTPMGRFEFLLGKMLPVACVGLFDVLLVTLVAVAWFHVPFRGSFPALVMGSLLFLASTLGLGLLISSYASTQQQAMLLAFFVIMPAVILSGFAFPIHNMPVPAQYLTYLDPLRYFMVIIRDVFLKGGGIAAHGVEFAMMLLLGGAAMGLSIHRLR
jgi:ABC-2 type transport system permease protein